MQLTLFDEPYTITSQHFDNELTNPRFISWIKATGKEIGDTWKPWEYMAWINKNAIEFKEVHKLSVVENIGMLKGGHEVFTDFLEDRQLTQIGEEEK
ncbi:hypothetical protein [Lederbergia lenta]|uniref:hypothetical protein n=1 Tax=Lederbergia lenta TaxID=1467 RepID=UPI002040FD63|nr:hypothetical protein [Lederbergia lenta]MCM3110658.1 hypothetical protein [Lederbergia lenta]